MANWMATIEFKENCEEDQGISNFVRPVGGEVVGREDSLKNLGRVCDVVLATHSKHPPLDIIDGVVKVMILVVLSPTLLENFVKLASDGRLRWRHGLDRSRSSGTFGRERGEGGWPILIDQRRREGTG